MYKRNVMSWLKHCEFSFDKFPQFWDALKKIRDIIVTTKKNIGFTELSAA